MPIFNRAYRLTLQIDKVLKTYQELNVGEQSLKIDFEVDMSAGGSFSKGNLTITGLKQNDIAFLATNFTKEGAFKDSMVELEVGYKDNTALILSGNISKSEANFTSPDQSLKLEVMSAFSQSGKDPVSNSISKNATFRDICNLVALNNKLTLKYDNTIPNKVIGDYSYRGTPYQQIQKLREYMPNDVDITIKNNTLEVVNAIKKGTISFIISSETGMIGTPSPTNIGCVVRTLLNPNIQVNDFVELKSSKIKQLDGDYRVIELKHRGSNRGDLYETLLTLRNV